MLAPRIEHIAIDHVNPYDGNPRDHNDRQIAKLVGIIRMVGFLVPIIIDDGNTIIAGHARWAAAKRLGLHSIPAIRAAHLSAHQAQAFRLADNRIGDESTWNRRAVALELKAIVDGIDCDLEVLELTAFETSEIDVHLESLEEISAPDRADLLPVLGPAVTRLGDVWCLQRHRLLCGSALNTQSYQLLLRGERVRAVWSDPPYNVPVSGHVCGLGKIQHREFAMASGEMDESEFTSFLTSYLELSKQNSVPGALHYVCMDGPQPSRRAADSALRAG